jgi:hypothetical protein
MCGGIGYNKTRLGVAAPQSWLPYPAACRPDQNNEIKVLLYCTIFPGLLPQIRLRADPHIKADELLIPNQMITDLIPW